MRRVRFMAILLIAVVLSSLVACSRARRGASPPTPGPAANAPQAPLAPSQRRVTIYLAHQVPGGLPGEFALAPVERVLAPTDSLDLACLQALAEGPTKEEEASGFVATLPPGTRVLSVTREGGVVTANFSHELRDNFQGGGEWEEVVLYSIVNTLTEMEGVESVRVLIDNAPVESIGGHLAADEPLRRNNEIIARGKRGP